MEVANYFLFTCDIFYLKKEDVALEPLCMCLCKIKQTNGKSATVF